MNILLYGNGGSGNHGCEAIVRGTVEILGAESNRYRIQSASVEQDLYYGLDQIAAIQSAKKDPPRDLRFLRAYFRNKVLHDYAAMDILPYLEPIRHAAEGTGIALSVGGDNYCYGGTDFYRNLNCAYQKAGFKTVLWGCSVEPAVVEQRRVQEDLKRYHLIVARESITYEAIRKVTSHVICVPDPAFRMRPAISQQRKLLADEDVIGINVSPMIISNETEAGITQANYIELIRYILDHTKSKIALIPHVVWEQNDDRRELRRLYDSFDEKDRFVLVEDQTAPELKDLIGRCRLFIGARTHATIAAYSACVPTLVVGYSVKARGIAKDLFGTAENYVIPVQNLKNESDLADAFKWLVANEEPIRQRLEHIMPTYQAECDRAISALENVLQER